MQTVDVRCRTGSSESLENYKKKFSRVRCRTGSSEICTISAPRAPVVRCRTGSSEKREAEDGAQ